MYRTRFPARSSVSTNTMFGGPDRLGTLAGVLVPCDRVVLAGVVG
jgi:hypothetical protein